MNVHHEFCSDMRLLDMLRREDAGDEDQQMFDHVLHCVRCQKRLEELAATSDDWHEAGEMLAANAALEQEPHAQKPAWSVLQYGDRPLAWTESMAKQLLSPASHPEMLGRIGRYEVERLIGAGGMGVVFKAFDTELNRPVAIKLLAPFLAGSGPARKRFAREARAAAAVVHEHVVPIHNVETDHASPFLVMHYVAGESLQGRLNRVGPLEVCEILRIGMQTSSGLAAAHAQGLVHRDIKPSNILLEQGVERALITDFGLAQTNDDASLTRTGYHPGTPQYMSPEQARGDSVDARSDLFSLGSVIYAMCTSRPPFRAETSYGILTRIIETEPIPIQDINPHVPAWLCMLISKLMAKPREDRYATAREVSELLEACLAHVQQPTTNDLPVSLSTRTDTTPLMDKRNGILKRVPLKYLLIGFALVCVMSWIKMSFAHRNTADDRLVSLFQVSGDLKTTAATPAFQSPILDGDEEENAQRILESTIDFWKGVNSFRVKQTQIYERPEMLPMHSILVAEKPNRLMLRYVDWNHGRTLVSDGKTFRINYEALNNVTHNKQDRFFIEGSAPNNLFSFLDHCPELAHPVGVHFYADEQLMSLLPLTANIQEYWRKRGWPKIRYVGSEKITVDGYEVNTHHLQAYDHERGPDHYKMNLWIASDGPPLLVRSSGLSPFAQSVTYSNWILNPELRAGTFGLPSTLGYQRVELKLDSGQ